MIACPLVVVTVVLLMRDIIIESCKSLIQQRYIGRQRADRKKKRKNKLT